MVGYSFVRRPEDVVRLQSALEKLNRPDLGIILKIETEEAFQNLPRLLLQAMKSPRVGVMIARGDLAVELGFQRISEVQEEILWICEAAHIPNIWATQVLEKLAKKGVATRSEITDAAMSARSECVMLNKGPYILDTVRILRNIIDRMSNHQFKRRNRLRPLQVAQTFWEEEKDRFVELVE
jgi:pyruvate kinase